MNNNWWKEGVVYQIYPRSFKDASGDGVGDLRGIIEKLDYIQSLGVDIVWLCPVYQSPNDDNGYDISDYRAIMDEFGSMADFDALLAGMKQRGLRLIMDLVANHTSDEHPWFQESRKAKDNPYRDYYFWKPPNEAGGPPNNWVSFFSGPAWEFDKTTGEYYLHLFTRKQPDLNWENPKVREEIYDIMRFWFEKGVDGFRLDAISLISKNLIFPDATTDSFTQIIEQYYANGPRMHEFLQEMHEAVLDEYDVMTVGEGPGINLKNGLLYVDPERKELHTLFHFGHMYIDNGPGGKYDPVPWSFQQFKKVFDDWDKALSEEGGWLSIFLGNHDFPRIVSRFGNDKEYWKESAKMLCMLLMSMRGTPYIYQGDEIGMTNVAFPDISQYRDVETLNAWKTAKAAGRPMDKQLALVHMQSRDNARTPIQWNDSPNAGFSSGNPWIGINPNYPEINVAQQEQDPDSILNFYRKMVALRKENPELVYAHYEDLLPDHPQLFAYDRKGRQMEFRVILNFSDQQQSFNMLHMNGFSPLMSNYATVEGHEQLQPWQGIIYQKRK